MNSKLFITLSLSLCFLQTVDAKPHPISWLKHHPIVVKEGAAIIGASIHAAGLKHCRQGDVERCDAGYGASWLAFGFTTGLNTAVFIPLSQKCDHEDQGRAFCAVFSYGGSVGQAVWGIHEYRQYRPEKVHPPSMVNKLQTQEAINK